MKILVINGPNMNFLGIRDTSAYGHDTYNTLIQMLQQHGEEIGAEVELWQSNHEGAIIDKLQESYYDKALSGIIINPGAYSHYSYAIYDALQSVFIPKVEVHISASEGREPFRSISVTAPACDKQIFGHGLQGYVEAMDYIRDQTHSS